MIATAFLQSIALVGGTVHSFAPGQEAQVATILLDGERIQAVGADLPIPDGCKTIDLTGFHLLPGLIDGMINHDPDHDALYLAAGITLARDTGNDLNTILLQKTRAQRDRVPGPDLVICGQVFDGLESASTDALRLVNGERAGEVLDYLFQELSDEGQALDYLSFLETLPKDSWETLLLKARGHGLPVWGPLPAGVTLAEALQAGQAGFLGLQAVLPPGSTWLNMEPNALEAAIRSLRDAQGGVTPLLSAYGRMLADHDVERAMTLMGPFYESTWRTELEQWADGLTAEKRSELQTVVEHQGQLLRMLHEAGVPLLPGSAAPNSWILPGQGFVDELELWARAGIDRKAVLAYATREAARQLGVLKDRGTLEAGKLADILVVGDDPEARLSALRQPEMVVLRGQVFERRQLAERVEALVAKQAQIRADLAKDLVVPAPNATEGDLVLEGSAETSALGSRICVEHFMVRRIDAQHWLYATRMIYPKTATDPAKEVHLVQVMEENLLQRFDLRISAQGVQTLPSEGPVPAAPDGSSLQGQAGADNVLESPLGILQVQGNRIAGTKILNIEHRKDGLFLSSLRSKETVTSIDVSLVLDALITAKHCPEGLSYVVSFEGSALEPIVDRWNLIVREKDHLLQMHTSRGVLAFGLDAKGTPLFAGRERGNSRIFAQMVGEVNAFGGPGLGLEPGRVFVIPAEEPEPEEATAPK
ncbi:MAG: amidohydrolase family protein [Planctomycetes bacterium]|nr:amidohydrolase family protein [Planctomycetota bacterium]MCB9910468.1 amidohydrolase family protein [Planctomycetota bacterium]